MMPRWCLRVEGKYLKEEKLALRAFSEAQRLADELGKEILVQRLSSTGEVEAEFRFRPKGGA